MAKIATHDTHHTRCTRQLGLLGLDACEFKKQSCQRNTIKHHMPKMLQILSELVAEYTTQPPDDALNTKLSSSAPGVMPQAVHQSTQVNTST